MVDFNIAFEILSNNHNSIVSDLQKYETYDTAIDEVERCILFLKTIDAQCNYFQECRISCSCVFLPLNQPLYSFFLQVISIALISDRVIFRPPEALRGIYDIIYKRFRLCFDNIDIFCGTRNAFLHNYVRNAEVVNFTGKYENALTIVRNLKPNQLLIFNGGAINPIVIDSDANISVSSKAVLDASLYNSGQDCMAPAMVFLQDDIKDEFLLSLERLVDQVCVGDYSNPKVSIGPLISKDAFKEAVAFINDKKAKIVYGGKYYEERSLIYPTVFLYNDCSCVCEHFFYAPFIIAYVFKNIDEVIEYLYTPFAQIFKGYISYYGKKNECRLYENKELPILLYNTTLVDYEHPTREFGGYGEGCSFISFDNNIVSKPILLLREVYEWKRDHERKGGLCIK